MKMLLISLFVLISAVSHAGIIDPKAEKEVVRDEVINSLISQELKCIQRIGSAMPKNNFSARDLELGLTSMFLEHFRVYSGEAEPQIRFSKISGSPMAKMYWTIMDVTIDKNHNEVQRMELKVSTSSAYAKSRVTLHITCGDLR